MENLIHYYNKANWRTIEQLKNLSPEDIEAIEVVSWVFPFKVNNYVVNSLIDWTKGPEDPMFRIAFPHKDMLEDKDYQTVLNLIKNNAAVTTISEEAKKIRTRLNPHPAQQAKNVPYLDGKPLQGIQHKYKQTVLFFPREGQNCHTWCTFCFRWPQFTTANCEKFSSGQIEDLCNYLAINPQVTDILFTGGDPLSMKCDKLAKYIEPILSDRCQHVHNIRIGSKSLAWWPSRFLDCPDSKDLLKLFEKISKKRSLTFVAHWTHPRELSNKMTQEAIRLISSTGAVVLGQSAILKGVNDSPDTIANLWRSQRTLGCIPYYLFIARDTGARRSFEIPLYNAWQIFRQAFSKVSGLCKTVRGPVMSCGPGKVLINGAATIGGQEAFLLNFLQARKEELVNQPFFAKFDPKATWWEQLQPFGPQDQAFFG